MKIIQLTQGKEALIDDLDFDWLNQNLWHIMCSHNAFYAVRMQRRGDGKQIHIYMHDVIGEKMGLIGSIDHADRNSLNNQRYNLRVATASQSNANRGTPSNNTSGFKGVSWDSKAQKWKAGIRFKKHLTHLGYFDSPILAAEAYDRAAIRLFGKFAVLNFPI